MKWDVVYERAIDEQGNLLFPQKLSLKFLEDIKKSIGPYKFSNQYLNEVIPTDMQTFKKEWIKYYEMLPDRLTTFVFVDPALSEADTADSTGIVVVSVCPDGDWYVRYAHRHRVSPPQLIEFIFDINAHFQPNCIGIEQIAYQKALLYFLDEEMRRRSVILPVKGIGYPSKNSKETRILSLVPRFAYNHLFLKQGLTDLELELLKFPRAAHDDLMDALAGIEYIAYKPAKVKKWERPPAPNHPDYEKWRIEQIRNGTLELHNFDNE